LLLHPPPTTPVYTLSLHDALPIYLFRLANHHHALVLGTGDLSEIALGWSTYGVGDHMSHYNVNASVPKTLMKALLRWLIASGQLDRKSTRLNSSHVKISYAVFCLK